MPIRLAVPVPTIGDGQMIALVQQGLPQLRCRDVFAVVRAKSIVPYLQVIHPVPVLHIKGPAPAGTDRRAQLKRMGHAAQAAGRVHLIDLVVYIGRHCVPPVHKVPGAQHQHVAKKGGPLNTRHSGGNAVIQLPVAGDSIVVGQSDQRQVVIIRTAQQFRHRKAPIGMDAVAVKFARQITHSVPSPITRTRQVTGHSTQWALSIACHCPGRNSPGKNPGDALSAVSRWHCSVARRWAAPR